MMVLGWKLFVNSSHRLCGHLSDVVRVITPEVFMCGSLLVSLAALFVMCF